MKQKSLKKYFVIFLIAALVCGMLTGCGGGNDKEMYKIGIVQLVSHGAGEAAADGFKQALLDSGLVEGETVTFIEQNGQNEQSNLESIAQSFISEDVDLICAVSTSTAQVMAAATDEIPIVGTAITNYEETRLVESNEAPGYNVTGTSDQNPIEKQGELLLDLVPDAKNVGIVYNASEVNSQLQVANMTAYMQSRNVTVVESTFADINHMQQATQALVGKVDAIYLPTDNAVASSMAQVVTVAEEAKLPVICGAITQVEGGGIATYGIDYYKLGYQSGEMALKILNGEAEPAAMPIEFANEDDLALVINKGEADLIGLDIPQELLEQAQFVETK
ncbi:MAG: ABC transporter substrate-binding protein [Peptococcaceae bacterium]|nr:ABC transporter substrate-binding protein [Peptococcaceae bacterium]MBO5114901.1 ABC transporter substrate-binding protein [Peptococcaceae bacterium]MBO5366244.1 ABC transporter substrate-binding protein [Peptococcaceae bacterium]MBP3584907.1 ABC transporter substrate-binding protein [Peptococcaceae bacterium]